MDYKLLDMKKYDNLAFDTGEPHRPELIYVTIDELLQGYTVIDKGTIFDSLIDVYKSYGYENILIMHNGKLISLNIITTKLHTPFQYYGMNIFKNDEPSYKYLYSYNLCDCNMTDAQIIHSNKEMELAEQNRRYDFILHNCDYCKIGEVRYPDATYCCVCHKCACFRHTKKN